MARLIRAFLPFISLALLAIIPPFSCGLLAHQQQNSKSQSSSSLAQPFAAAATTLRYHGGRLLTSPVNIYLIWYGSFSPNHKATISNFFAAFKTTTIHHEPTVSTWWATIEQYKDSTGKPASVTVNLAGQTFDASYFLGKSLDRVNLAYLVKTSMAKHIFPFDPSGIYLVLTASDVTVERFCMSSCGFHDTVLVSPGKYAIMAHVGDPGVQCPGLCAWPFARPAYGPREPPLVAPNGVGVDGMVMNVAAVVGGAVTNPFHDGYYQGDRRAPLEASTACAGIFGPGAYPGYPGKLMIDRRSRASFNVYGAGGRKFLLPAIWDPVGRSCKVWTNNGI